MSEALTGGCLCGRVRFELTEPPHGAGYCHCTRCQRRTGTAASASAGIDGTAFRIVSGEELVRTWRHPDGGFEKAFCSECGAHLFSRDPEDHSRMGVRMAAFDAESIPPDLRPAYRQFTAYAAAWEPIPDDGLPRFPEARSS
jgi:hypothetical protein